MGTWWSDHPDLEGVASRGRRELEEEAAAAEHDTELLRQRRRHLTDVCYEWMARGDLVTVAAAGHRFEGHLTAAVNDLVVVETKTQTIALNTHALHFVRSDRVGSGPGTTGDRTISSFRAYLGKYEVEGTPTRLIGAAGAFDVIGVIEASTEDHVLVRDAQGSQWALPRSLIAIAMGETATER